MRNGYFKLFFKLYFFFKNHYIYIKYVTYFNLSKINFIKLIIYFIQVFKLFNKTYFIHGLKNL